MPGNTRDYSKPSAMEEWSIGESARKGAQGFSLKELRDYFGLKDSRKERQCYLCRKWFDSKSAGERKCYECKRSGREYEYYQGETTD